MNPGLKKIPGGCPGIVAFYEFIIKIQVILYG
jgi:hypothetical protein